MHELNARPRTWLRQTLRIVAWGVVGGTAASAMGLFGHFVATDERLTVSEVDITGNDRVSDAALRHLTDIRTGQHLFSVDLGRAVSQVETHPWVRDASARRVYPGRIVIDVTERTPDALLALEEVWYVDSSGWPYRRATTDDVDHPVITGIEPSFVDERPEHAAAAVWGAGRVLRSARAQAGIDADRVSEIHFDASHGYELVLRSGTRLVVGFGDPSTPFSRVPALIQAGLDLERPQVVDLDAERVAIATPLPEISGHTALVPAQRTAPGGMQ